jgi:Uma2 family endonuclease
MGRTVAQTAPKLTYDDFVLFPDDGKRHELIDGEHFVTAAPNVRHQRVLQNLNRILDRFVEEHRLGRVFFAPLDVVFSLHDVVEPDLIFVSRERESILATANLQGAPDLVVEVLSPATRRRDELLKRDLYERMGVAEYWVVDPLAETVKVYRRAGDDFARVVLLSARDDDQITSPLLPGLEIPLATVFAD